jgi:hypothetical protein
MGQHQNREELVMSSPADVQMFRVLVTVAGHPEMPNREYTILGKRSFVARQAMENFRSEDFLRTPLDCPTSWASGKVPPSMALNVDLVPIRPEVGTILPPEAVPNMRLHTVRKFRNNPGKGRKNRSTK